MPADLDSEWSVVSVVLTAECVPRAARAGVILLGEKSVPRESARACLLRGPFLDVYLIEGLRGVQGLPFEDLSEEILTVPVPAFADYLRKREDHLEDVCVYLAREEEGRRLLGGKLRFSDGVEQVIRPSSAILIALLLEVPIYAHQNLLDSSLDRAEEWMQERVDRGKRLGANLLDFAVSQGWLDP